MEKLNIYQKLLAISNELETVAKNLNVGIGKSSYKAVGEADVLRAVKPLEAKYGVYSYPIARNLVESSVIESIDFNGNVKKQQFMRLEIIYRFVNTDNPAEYVDITSFGDGIDSGDKATGKAMTYADKYALMKAYKIITGDDPDQHPSEELQSKAEKVVKATAQQIEIITKAYENKQDKYAEMLKMFNVEKVEDLTVVQANKICKAIKEKAGK